MTRLIVADRIEPQPWRNGGGATRELFAWPSAADWQLRVSLADIVQDGPFSAFPGVERHFAVLSGAGVELMLEGLALPLTPRDGALRFDGAVGPGCRLLDGPTRDLNLMLRGLSGKLQRADAQPWSEAWDWRALFCAGRAELALPDGRGLSLEPRSLVLDLPPGALRLKALDAEAPAYWLGAMLKPS
jgi:environmental stress-induced protein Ves